MNIFKTQHTAEFNLTNENLKEIKDDVKDIFRFMKAQALIDDSVICYDSSGYQISSLQQLSLSAISANGWDCFCEFCIMFFTHFIVLWDRILFDGPLEIKKSAQLRKFVNFLRETQINQAPSDLTLADFEVKSIARLK